MDPLLTSLLDLIHALRDDGIPLTIGGGFGLYLKRRHLDRTGERTLLDQLPEPRSTNDLDLFIRAEILADLAKTRRVADAIRSLGYEPVAGAEYMQWRRPVPVGGETQYVKLDLLVGPIGSHQSRLKVNGPRARPKGDIQLHARWTDEALTIDTRPVAVTLAGRRSGGEAAEETVFVPDAFPYLMMKLFAFHDRRDDPQKDVGRHHALDLYTVIGMMTEAEYDRAVESGRELATDDRVTRARAIVAADFSGVTRPGVLRMREHPLFRETFQLEAFVGVLGDIIGK